MDITILADGAIYGQSSLDSSVETDPKLSQHPLLIAAFDVQTMYHVASDSPNNGRELDKSCSIDLIVVF